MFGFLLPQEFHQEAAHMGGVGLQLLLLQDIQDSQPHGAGHRVAPKLSQRTGGMSDAQESCPQIPRAVRKTITSRSTLHKIVMLFRLK